MENVVELEAELNRLWIERCKANENLLDFIAKLQASGYIVKISDNVEKQLEIQKK